MIGLKLGKLNFKASFSNTGQQYLSVCLCIFIFPYVQAWGVSYVMGQVWTIKSFLKPDFLWESSEVNSSERDKKKTHNNICIRFVTPTTLNFHPDKNMSNKFTSLLWQANTSTDTAQCHCQLSQLLLLCIKLFCRSPAFVFPNDPNKNWSGRADLPLSPTLSPAVSSLCISSCQSEADGWQAGCADLRGLGLYAWI